ncbi:DEAD-box ATP-dependent RNA helicase 38 [Rosa chinensis]|uniref:DEAD-box ATP-dependent RNA helicase 38 n=1 Tax=Rosa chinensis TaxID=74649 RepID=UPI001AD904F5|nr:DEAD-box ATP-dependent RNA helicase 38 [Rosa chinensis]
MAEKNQNDAVSTPPSSLDLELNIAGLNIGDHKSSICQAELQIAGENKFLDEREDSNISAVTNGNKPYTSASNFEDLHLSEELLKGLYVEMGFKKPSKIQAITLPMILTTPYKDLVAQAHNGSGKTTCFVLGMLSRVDQNVKAPQALCICPTRELALQNGEVIRKMGKYTGINVESAVPMEKEKSTPVKYRPLVSAQIVIGTPGTVKNLMSYKKLGVSGVKILVFDEADHMLAEDGFKDDSLRIKKEIEKFDTHCQVLQFSATFDETVRNFISRVVKDKNELFVKKEELSLAAVKQYKVYCPDELTKIDVIKTKIFDLGENIGQRIIFVGSKASARMLHKQLHEDGYAVTNVHGALTPEHRDKTIKEFREGYTQVLIATDMLARGFDSQQVNCVVNYDLPIKYQAWSRKQAAPEPDYEVYLHRCGRAGRFGRKGAVFNLLCHDSDQQLMGKIEQHYSIQVPEVNISEEAFDDALKLAGLKE